MKASELINALTYLIETHGDLPMFVEHESNDKVFIITLPDIGFFISKDEYP